ncbi:MAG TPA: LuxR C-terminal-related transcriptional regulator, partial [Symbiobacteriaceae bacterium]|nr:LuxR C-terminal-related transcriptional regulator [Symbiobacteriaceae bacterium]
AYGAASRGEPGAARALAREALRLLPPDERTVRPVVGFVLGGLAYMAGDLAEAAQAFSTAAAAGGETHLGISALSALGGLRAVQGRLREAAGLFRQAAESPLPAGGNALARLGDLHREWNELDTALDLIHQGLRRSRAGANLEAVVARHISLARIHLALGDLPRAKATLQEAQAQGISPQVIGDLESCRVALWLAAGDLEAAKAWAPPPFERAQVAKARVLVALGQGAEAAALLDTLAAAAEAGGRFSILIEILAVQAVALHRCGDDEKARATLARALRLSEPEGYIRTFLDEGAALTDLLRTLPAGAYVERLLGAAPAPVLTTPVSPREREILGLIAAGLTNEEIAARLFLSVLTVKRHISNLYAKLGVARRTEALAVARDLGLL